MSNSVINIMLRQVGRIWEAKATCALHDTSSSAAYIDDRDAVLMQTISELPCDCSTQGNG